MNKSGKTLIVFLVIISILSLALTVIAVFFFQKESELRKAAESDLAQTRTAEAKLQADLKEAKKQVFLLEEKAKEADEKINGLMDDLELAQGVRDEMKAQNETLKEALDTESKSKEELRTQLTGDLEKAKEKVASLEQAVEAAQQQRSDLEAQIEELKKTAVPPAPVPSTGLQSAPGASPAPAEVPPAVPSLEPQASDSAPSAPKSEPPVELQEKLAPPLEQSRKEQNTIELEPIIVGPKTKTASVPPGKILSVDKENDFVIFDLGQKDGIVQGLTLSIYRDSNYLGDIKVSRVQPEMSAADFIPPFTSQKVRKNDQVVFQK